MSLFCLCVFFNSIPVKFPLSGVNLPVLQGIESVPRLYCDKRQPMLPSQDSEEPVGAKVHCSMDSSKE